MSMMKVRASQVGGCGWMVAPMVSTGTSSRMVVMNPTTQWMLQRKQTEQLGSIVTAAASKKGKEDMSEADLYVSVEDSSVSSTSVISTLPWYAKVPIGFALVIVTLRTLKAVMRGRDRSLEKRGFKRGGVADEKYYSDIMKGVRTVSYDELSPEQMEAARRRRRIELSRDSTSLDLEDVELPENHPFAVKQNLSKEEEELQKLRLSARRGLSPEDMRRLREQQALADQMEREQEQRQKQ